MAIQSKYLPQEVEENKYSIEISEQEFNLLSQIKGHDHFTTIQSENPQSFG
jgi:hypothetical protein